MEKTEKITERLTEVVSGRDDIYLALLYGSAATGKLRPDSDVDVAVSAGRVLSPEERLEISESLSVAVDRRVDLLDLERAEGLILHEVCTRNRVLKNQKPELYGRLIVRMLDHQTDMMPNIRYIWKQRRERYLDEQRRDKQQN